MFDVTIARQDVVIVSSWIRDTFVRSPISPLREKLNDISYLHSVNRPGNSSYEFDNTWISHCERYGIKRL